MSQEPEEQRAPLPRPADVREPVLSEAFTAADLARLAAELSEVVRAHLDSLEDRGEPER